METEDWMETRETGGQAEDEDSFAMGGGAPLGFVSAPRRRSLNRAPLKALKSLQRQSFGAGDARLRGL